MFVAFACGDDDEGAVDGPQTTVTQGDSQTSLTQGDSQTSLTQGDSATDSTTSAGDDPGSECDVNEIQLGDFSPALDFLPMYLAIDGGFFEQEGIKVKYFAFEGGSAGAAAMAAGDIDVASAGPGSVATAVAAGAIDAKIFYGFNMLTVYDISVTPDITSADDLRGKAVGVSKAASQTDLFMRAWLDSVGIDANSDVTVLEVGGTTDRIAALSNGQVAAAPINSSLRTAAEEAGGIKVLVPAEDNEVAFPTAGVVATQNFIDQHPGCLKAVSRALDAAIELMRSQPDSEVVLAAAQKYTGLEGDAALEGIKSFAADIPGLYDGSLDDSAFQNLIDAAAKLDPNFKSMTVDDLVDRSFSS